MTFPIFQSMYFFSLYNDNAEVARLELIGSSPTILSVVAILVLKHLAHFWQK